MKTKTNQMTLTKAYEILTSYCVGDRSKYHTCDTINALSWALNKLGRPENEN